MSAFYKPDLETELDSPFVRDEEDKLIRRSYWLDKSDKSLVMIMKRLGVHQAPSRNQKII